MLKVVPSKNEVRKDFELSLDEIAREGARRLLMQALNLEVEEYIVHRRSTPHFQGAEFVME